MSPKRRAAVKQRYETSPHVQRWLRENATDTVERPPFEPSLVAGLRDRDWLLSSLQQFYEQGLIDDVLQVVKSGKEATVYCCAGGPATDAALLAAKIYRPRMFRSLSNDAIYRSGRLQRNMDGQVVHNGARPRMSNSVRGRTAQVTAWIDDEWTVHQTVFQAGADVPRPIRRIGNAVLMEFVGDDEGVAPLLREIAIDPDEAYPLWEQAIHNVETFLRHDCIHGDLSAYNMLYWQGRLVVIDFAQAVDPRHNPDVYPLLARDVERVHRYFAPYGVQADPAQIAVDMWNRYLRGTL